jgi:ABC-type transport system involved in multi-copper enzyme maturation permease subunit
VIRKLWAIAWKELYTTLRDRNLILIMFATPLALSTIIGLAFGSLGGDSPSIGTINVAVVNQDQGFNLDELLGGTVTDTTALSATASVTAPLSAATPLSGFANGFAFNLGDIVTSILLSEPITATGFISNTGGATGALPDCPIASSAPLTSQGSLADLLHGTRLADVAAARQGVEGGDYAVAVLIPAGFTNTFLPAFGVVDNGDLADRPQIEVYGNNGDALSASIVNSIVSGIVSQFERLPVTLEATIDALLTTVDVDALDGEWLIARLNELQRAGDTGDLGLVTVPISGTGTLTDTFAVLGCLFTPGINPVTLAQQPLNTLQERSTFDRVLVIFGSAQAVFFALFTGVFGVLSIYDERKQWTLQRMLASPTGGNTILLGKLLGNLVVVVVQLLVLLLALTVVASIINGRPTMIWGNQLPLVLLVVVIVSLAVSGIGVLIVGLARTPEQVQVIGPLVNMTLGVLGGSFGFALPAALSQLSLIYWGTDAFEKLAGNDLSVGVNLLILAAQGLLFFVVGAWFFRRRLNLS